jgi:hypothetical protein
MLKIPGTNVNVNGDPEIGSKSGCSSSTETRRRTAIEKVPLSSEYALMDQRQRGGQELAHKLKKKEHPN